MDKLAGSREQRAEEFCLIELSQLDESGSRERVGGRGLIEVERRGRLIVRLIAIEMLWDSLVYLSLPCSSLLTLVASRLDSSSHFDEVLLAQGLVRRVYFSYPEQTRSFLG